MYILYTHAVLDVCWLLQGPHLDQPCTTATYSCPVSALTQPGSVQLHVHVHVHTHCHSSSELEAVLYTDIHVIASVRSYYIYILYVSLTLNSSLASRRRVLCQLARLTQQYGKRACNHTVHYSTLHYQEQVHTSPSNCPRYVQLMLDDTLYTTAIDHRLTAHFMRLGFSVHVYMYHIHIHVHVHVHELAFCHTFWTSLLVETKRCLTPRPPLLTS